MYNIIFSSVLCCIFSITYGAKILGVFMTPSHSHQLVYQPIWKELSLQGHEVTVVTTNPLKDPTLTNLTEIDVGEISYKIWNKNLAKQLGSAQHDVLGDIKDISNTYMEITHAQLSHPEVQAIVNNTHGQKFDLFLVEYLYPSMYNFKDVYNCPMIGILSLPLASPAYSSLGMSQHPVLNPEVVLPFSEAVTFKERVTSTVFKWFFSFGTAFLSRPKISKVVRQYFGPNARSVDELTKDVSMVIVNSNLALQNVKPTVPAMVEISGIHLQEKRKALPKDLKKFLDLGKDGVIYFSLGSNVKSHLMPFEKREEILKAFSELPYRVLWKFETDDFPNKPKNVEIMKWVPQQDVLAHPNVKLFISQGGIQSLDEAVYHQIPVLTIPFFGDQRFNSHKLTQSGAGLQLNFQTFNKDELKDKIVELIKNPKYKQKMSRLSAIASDQPMSALEKAVWNINYVLRHNGASHLRYKAIDMPFYKYYMLDVYLFVATIVSILFYVLSQIYKRVRIGYDFCKQTFQNFGVLRFSKSKNE